MEQEEKRYSILDELAKCSGYDIALMTTFNFEIGFFERAVLNRLYAKDVKTISLFVDAKELTNALNEFDVQHSGSHIGRRYMVNPVKMDRSFHPKVILLLGEKKARLFIGSANIKTSGYATNNEVFNFFDYDANHPEYLDVIVAAIDFFCDINEVSYKLDNQVLKAAKEYIYYHKAEKNGELFLLHNMKESMLEQLGAIIPDEVKSISVAVPYYDNELLGLQGIKKRFPNAEVELFVQNKYSTFPIEYNEKNHIAGKINTFSGFEDNTSSTSANFFHGKVFLFKTTDKAYVFYGSANCTMSAMTKSFSDGGNIECDFLEVGGLSDFDYFFDNMTLATDEEFTSQKMVYETPEPVNFSFKYGEIKETVELHLGFSKKVEELTVKLRDKELEYEIKKDELIVYINEECRDFMTDIFEITIAFDDKSETLRCWTYSPIALANNREKQNNRDSLSDFEIESTGDKYIEDRIKFFKAEATCLNEWQEYKNNLKYMNQIKMEQEGESDEPEDFVIDYQIPDEYRLAYKQYSAVSKIRNMFVRRFLGLSVIEDLSENGEKHKRNVDELPKDPAERAFRKATTEEKKFERFIKGKVKGMMNDVYVEVIELEHYIGLVQVVMEIFEKYCEHDPVEDIFTPDYVVLTKASFLRKIVGKPLDGIPEKDEMQNAIIKKCFETMLENYLFYRELSDSDERWEFESLNKSLLMTVEKKYGLRSTYKRFVKELIDDGIGAALTLGFNGACAYIEQIYGYKTYEMLCATIGGAYPNAEVTQRGSSLFINLEADGLRDYFRPDTNVLREIANYSRHVAKISSVTIVIKNITPNPEGKNIIVENRHTIGMDYHQWRLIQTRLDGEKMDNKSQYLPF